MSMPLSQAWCQLAPCAVQRPRLTIIMILTIIVLVEYYQNPSIIIHVMCISLSLSVSLSLSLSLYIYIYIEREREIERYIICIHHRPHWRRRRLARGAPGEPRLVVALA